MAAEVTSMPSIAVFWSFRSPYSYLATGRLVDRDRGAEGLVAQHRQSGKNRSTDNYRVGCGIRSGEGLGLPYAPGVGPAPEPGSEPDQHRSDQLPGTDPGVEGEREHGFGFDESDRDERQITRCRCDQRRQQRSVGEVIAVGRLESEHDAGGRRLKEARHTGCGTGGHQHHVQYQHHHRGDGG